MSSPLEFLPERLAWVIKAGGQIRLDHLHGHYVQVAEVPILNLDPQFVDPLESGARLGQTGVLRDGTRQQHRTWPAPPFAMRALKVH